MNGNLRIRENFVYQYSTYGGQYFMTNKAQAISAKQYNVVRFFPSIPI